MTRAKTLSDPRGWSSVRRWTMWGTLVCVVIATSFNLMLFEDLGRTAVQRAVLSATIVPILLAGPLFFYMSMRLRGMAITNRRLGMVARTDSLTTCLNRGAFTARVGELLDRRTPERSGALLMIDADNFKAINDLFGHDVGDEALQIIARSIRAVLRGGDLVGRMGGEEFGVYLPNADQRAAEAIAERIRRSVNLAVFTPDGRQRSLSVSLGGVVFEGAASFADLFRIADQHLYCAKQTGRNRATIVHVNDHPAIDVQRSA